MAGGGKFITAEGEIKSKKGVAEEKGKRVALKTKKAMDFDSKLLCVVRRGG